MKLTLREKCPYSEFFWSLFSLIRTEYRYLFWSPTARKYGPEKLQIRTCFIQFIFSLKQSDSSIVIEDCEYGKVRVHYM